MERLLYRAASRETPSRANFCVSVIGWRDEYKNLSSYYLTLLCLWQRALGSGQLPLSLLLGLIVKTLQEKFGQVIRRRRLELGLGQEALADKATLHRTHVSLIERGLRMPTLGV